MVKELRKDGVVLVYPNFKCTTGDMPWGIASVATYLKKKLEDCSVSVIDTSFNPSLKYVEGQLELLRPKIVGIYMNTLMYDDSLKVAKLAKQYNAKVIVGGPHPTVMPESVIVHDDVDALCCGEGELTMVEYVRRIFGNDSLDGLKGIWVKEGEEILKNVLREPIEDLDSLSVDLKYFDMDKYIKNWFRMDSYDLNLRGITICVSRGCPFACTYCQPNVDSIFGKIPRIASPQKVVRELKDWRNRYNINALYLTDDTLTIFRKWIVEFCNLMIREKLDMKWACNTRVDTIDEELLGLMKEAGCVKLMVGLETYSNRILNEIYKKNITIKKINIFLSLAKKKNIQVMGFFMIGAPTETKEEIKETIRFASDSSIDEAVFTVCMPLVGTHLYRMAKDNGWRLPKNYDDFDYNKPNRPMLFDGDISCHRLMAYKRYAFLRFYLHPKRIIHTLERITNWKYFYRALKQLVVYF